MFQLSKNQESTTLMNNMLKKLLLSLAFTLACGSPDPLELDQTSADLSVKRYTGWQMNTVWEHQRCDMNITSQQCAFPTRYTSGTNPYKRLLIAPIESTPVPPGFNLVDARTFGTSYFTNMTTNSWEWVMTTQGTTAHLMIVSDESIYNGTPPNDTINLSTIAHVECTWNEMTYTETWNAAAYGCRQVVASLDVGSFTAWVNQWATSNNQRQMALESVYRHFLGVALGLGATNSTDTPMRRRLSRAQSPITIQAYEKCLLDAVNFNDPSFVDPALGVYTNNCN
jgi:hypothetical protein